MFMLPLFVLGSPALADLAPPRGYVEQCTVQKQCTKTQEGRTCEGVYSGRPECEALEREGFVQACQTYGASVWTEVMCRDLPEGEAGQAEARADDTPPKPTRKGTCRSGCSTSGWSGAGVGLVLLALAAGRRSQRPASP